MLKLILTTFLVIYLPPGLKTITPAEWGFYGHRLINRLAVFTLPLELIGFYKKHIDYISEHAVDPDKRRYTVKAEAIRHYFDLDHWMPTYKDKLPTDYALAILQFSEFTIQTENKTFPLFSQSNNKRDSSNQLYYSDQFVDHVSPYDCALSTLQFKRIFYTHFLPKYDPDHWIVNLNALSEYYASTPRAEKLLIRDSFSQHGILPYHFSNVYQQLIQAFSKKDIHKILRLSSEIGHYLGDAHVPLHTSKNYNGQLTDQMGIHSFWESRIPELFAEQDFDFIVGQAIFVEDVNKFIWNIIYESHSFVESLLAKEKKLSLSYPFDKQYCFERRGQSTVKLPCKKYAELYYQSLEDQVEQRMRKSILNLGSIWMSAWIEAGQPTMENINISDNFQNSPEIPDSISEPTFIPLRNHE